MLFKSRSCPKIVSIFCHFGPGSFRSFICFSSTAAHLISLSLSSICLEHFLCYFFFYFICHPVLILFLPLPICPACLSLHLCCLLPAVIPATNAHHHYNWYKFIRARYKIISLCSHSYHAVVAMRSAVIFFFSVPSELELKLTPILAAAAILLDVINFL